MEKAYKEPTFLTDKNHIIVLEAIIGAANAAIPDSLEPFEVLVPNTSDGAAEKHLPIIETNGSHVTVKVGSVFHPMSAEHSIQWVYLQTEKGCQRVDLCCEGEPAAVFALAPGDRPLAAYAYCNLHGFWKTML